MGVRGLGEGAGDTWEPPVNKDQIFLFDARFIWTIFDKFTQKYPKQSFYPIFEQFWVSDFFGPNSEKVSSNGGVVGHRVFVESGGGHSWPWALTYHFGPSF